MKRIIFILCVVVCIVSNLSAQRLNKYGQKMVSELEYQTYYENEIISIKYVYFQYNKNNELISYKFQRYSVYEKKNMVDIIATKKNNRIYLEGYSDNNYDVSNIEIYCNEHNLITKLVVNDGYKINGKTRDIFEYEYSDINNDGYLLLSKYNVLSQYKETAKSEWKTSEKLLSLEQTYKSSLEKDNLGNISNKETNVDLENIEDFYQFFRSTEWLPKRNYYFNNFEKFKVIHDERGNMIEIQNFGIYGKNLRNVIKLKYVE